MEVRFEPWPGSGVVPLSTQVYKRVPANLLLGVTLQWTTVASHPGGRRNIPSHYMLLKRGWALVWWATWLVYRVYLNRSCVLKASMVRVLIDTLTLDQPLIEIQIDTRLTLDTLVNSPSTIHRLLDSSTFGRESNNFQAMHMSLSVLR